MYLGIFVWLNFKKVIKDEVGGIGFEYREGVRIILDWEKF